MSFLNSENDIIKIINEDNQINWINFNKFIKTFNLYKNEFVKKSFKKIKHKLNEKLYDKLNEKNSFEKLINSISFEDSYFLLQYFDNSDNINNNVAFNSLIYKKRYYNEMFGVSNIDLEEISKSWLESMIWTSKYYFEGYDKVNIDWVYKYYYAPFFSDISLTLEKLIDHNNFHNLYQITSVNKNLSYLSYNQLYAIIIPQQFFYLFLKDNIIEILLDKLPELYIFDYKIDNKFTKLIYKYKSILPFIPINRLRELKI